MSRRRSSECRRFVRTMSGAVRPAALRRPREEQQAGRISGRSAPGGGRGDRRCGQMQAEVGLLGVTDGECLRGSWHIDFCYRIGGVGTSAQTCVSGSRRGRAGQVAPTAHPCRRQAHLDRTIFGADFADLKSVAPAGTMPKLTISSPSMLHYRGGRAAIDTEIYPEIDDSGTISAQVYKQEIAAFHALGCTYLQFDDTCLAYLNDPAQRAYVRCDRRRRRDPAPDQHR